MSADFNTPRFLSSIPQTTIVANIAVPRAVVHRKITQKVLFLFYFNTELNFYYQRFFYSQPIYFSFLCPYIIIAILSTCHIYVCLWHNLKQRKCCKKVEETTAEWFTFTFSILTLGFLLMVLKLCYNLML